MNDSTYRHDNNQTHYWVSTRTLLSTALGRVFAPVDLSPQAGIDGTLMSVWCNRLNR
ncbi:hypothetical protein JK358_03255 [Nocardia sp. 2]|uniref:Uncharacterized protein n=1 Tax=Nocardia acididurans TaxID=2802282 RepID=A0ABS1LYC4_9NOCA|nr:hypothetical protein [Nocardia acididurans]MBL1073408.1 hypothetical protein [Nocardia acididurans]